MLPAAGQGPVPPASPAVAPAALGRTPPALPAAPVLVPLADAAGPRTPGRPAVPHGCWYPSADPAGEWVAYICDRGGVPQLWTGPAGGGGGGDGSTARLLDTGPDPVTEVSWSPDGRWIAYTAVPGGGEHGQVLCVRPDGTGRRIVAGADPGTSAYLGCWARDGSALAVTVAAPPGGPAPGPGGGGTALGGALHGDVGHRAGTRDRLAAFLVDPDGGTAPVLVATETGAATLRVCDLTPDGRLALVRRGPRARREAVVVRTAGLESHPVLRVADGDPWIGRFAPDGRRLWLRSDEGREFAALLALELDGDGRPAGRPELVAGRPAADLELLAFLADGRTAALTWNVRGASELELLDPAGAGRPVELPHEVVTRIARGGPAGAVLGLSGSRRRPGVWWLPEAGGPARTPWSSRDADVVAGGRPPVRPEPLRLTARDGLELGGWYYRAPGRAPGVPAPCVVHLHGGPEEQERPVFEPLFHELLGRGLDVFAPDVRGSSGYGRSFTDADLGAGRFAAIEDVADCAAGLVLTGRADPARLAVTGRSYGGYLTMASLVWHPELFRTGVAVCGMSDFATFFAGTEPWIAESAAHKYGHPEHDRELLRALSPMSRIDALRVPLLAVHGEHDTNVPPGESEQFVRAARERGHPAELLTLRDEGHDFLRAENRRLFRRTAGDWLERYLTG
ncbi:S9 family peptidase [Streptomyces pyxinae]|uniref:S9 family peptidase n=1 Tax=Streptomyces pyxinae TaxID=2970734 RepID=UPI003D1810B8